MSDIPPAYAFTSKVNAALDQRGLTWSEAAAEIGCALPDLMLVCGGGKPDEPLRLKILRWLEYRGSIHAAE